MFQLHCTVRNCTHLLSHQEGGLFCNAGHHFDKPKGGFWNLLQPQDKKSLKPGDSSDAVMARHRSTIERVMDLGCGEGTFGPALFGRPEASYCGVELSKQAIRLAAKRWPEGTWVLANADRFLPAARSSVDCVISLFGRRPATEIARVLKEPKT